MNGQPHVFWRETLTSNFFRNLDYARGNEFIIYFTDLCKRIEIYIYARKQHPFASDAAAKHPYAASLWLKTNNKSQRNKFCGAKRALNFASAILLSTQVPLQKFPFLLRVQTKKHNSDTFNNNEWEHNCDRFNNNESGNTTPHIT